MDIKDETENMIWNMVLGVYCTNFVSHGQSGPALVQATPSSGAAENSLKGADSDQPLCPSDLPRGVTCEAMNLTMAADSALTA